MYDYNYYIEKLLKSRRLKTNVTRLERDGVKRDSKNYRRGKYFRDNVKAAEEMLEASRKFKGQ